MGKLTVNNLVKKFGETAAVNDVSLTVEDGESLTVVGPSGCGTTNISGDMVAGFIEPTGGKIMIDDHVLSDRAKGLRDVTPENRDIGNGIPVVCSLAAHECMYADASVSA